MVKHLPTVRETWVQSLGQEDPLEEGKATHSSIVAWRIPWTEEPGGLHSPWNRRVGHSLRFFYCFPFETAEGCVCPKSLICECEHIHFRGKSSHTAGPFMSQCLPFLDGDYALEFAGFLFCMCAPIAK